MFRRGGKESDAAEDFARTTLKYEDYIKTAIEVWNAWNIMRHWPHYLFVQLASALMAIHPFDHKYEVYTMEQLQVLERMLNEELTRVREAMLRRVTASEVR